MKVIVDFSVEQVKKALETSVEITENPELNEQLVVIHFGKHKGEDVDMVFTRDKIIPAYENAIENNEEFVSIEFESPTEEEFEEAGFKKEGDYYVNDKNEPKLKDDIAVR